MKINFQQIFKLKEMLECEGIPFEFRELKDFGGYQLFYPKDLKRVDQNGTRLSVVLRIYLQE